MRTSGANMIINPLINHENIGLSIEDECVLPANTLGANMIA